MILHSITIQNFKSYASSQTADFSNTDALSITGPNGAGKSTLIEALTYALYGRSTATERKELGNDAIIRDGEEEALATVRFEKDGQTYTVQRTARRKATGTATLTTSDGRTLHAGVAQVSKAVESIIGMDYETFVSSTIIRQDEMDKITDLRPSERKQILSKIFGLELYEKLKKNAHEKRLKTKAELEAGQQLRNQLLQKALNENEVQSSLQQAKATQKKAELGISRNKAELEKTEVETKKAMSDKTKYDVKLAHVQSLQREIDDTAEELNKASGEVETVEEAKNNLTDVQKQIEGVKNLDKLEAEIKKATSDKTKYDVKLAHIDTLQGEADDANEELEDTSEEVKAATEAKKDLEGIEKQLTSMQTVEKDLASITKSRDEVSSLATKFEQKAQHIQQQITEEQDHYEVVKTAKTAECPVCKRPLDEKHRKKVLEDYKTKLKQLQTEHDKNHNHSREEQTRLENEILPKLRELEKQAKKIQDLHVEKAELKSKASRLTALATKEKQLKTKITAKTKQKQLEESDLKALEKSVAKYETLLEQRAELSERLTKLREEKAKLESTISRLPTLLKTQEKLVARKAQKTKEKQEEESEVKTLESAVREYERLEKQKNDLSERLAELREEKAGAESSIGHLNTQLAEIAEAKKELERLKTQSFEQTRNTEIYGLLEDAFGKDGIPTAILRDLVPEVEEEASKILRELSNGRMNVNFRFGRPTRGGTPTDELVTEAEDGTGVHPVTRFSGGERMRINLALRLGISEVIARRSGYKGKIETLVIDEGFGALDEEGRQATIEILRQLRQRFKRIAIISHIEEVKDAFETKLIVSKNAAGQSFIEAI
jgi:exonuclease SbcC